MHLSRNVFVAATVAATTMACGASSEPTSSSDEALGWHGPNPGQYVCAGGPQTQVVWSPAQETLNSALTYYPLPTTAGTYVTYAGVDSADNVDLIVWVASSSAQLFGTLNEACYPPGPAPSGGPKPPPTPPGSGTRCPPPIALPGNAPCVTLSQLGGFATLRNCSSPTYESGGCTMGRPF